MPGRHGHAQLASPLGPPVASTGRTGLVDDLALAVAARAGGDVDHLAEHRGADVADLAAALALRAGHRRRAGLGAAAGARLAAPQRAELDLLLDAGDGLSEGQPQVVAQVRAGRRSAAAAGAACALAEEGIEDVAEALEAAERAVALRAATDPGVAEGVVGLATLRIGQDLVGLVDLLEPLVRPGLRADVRMPLLGELAEGALDVVVRRAAGHAEDVVVVTLGSHATGSIGSVAAATLGGDPKAPRLTVALTFDHDGIASEVRRGEGPTGISRGEFGPRVGVGRILDLLAREGIRSTWFVPGHTVETFPDFGRGRGRRRP